MSDEKMTNFEELHEGVMSNFNARTAYKENNLRRSLAEFFNHKRKQLDITRSQLATRSGCSTPQVNRALHEEIGGNLELRTLVRIADILRLTLTLNAKEEK